MNTIRDIIIGVVVAGIVSFGAYYFTTYERIKDLEIEVERIKKESYIKGRLESGNRKVQLSNDIYDGYVSDSVKFVPPFKRKPIVVVSEYDETGGFSFVKTDWVNENGFGFAVRDCSGKHSNRKTEISWIVIGE